MTTDKNLLMINVKMWYCHGLINESMF